MNETKLYVMEWDAWHFMGVFRNEIEAKNNIKHHIETIKEVTIKENIHNNTLFILIDRCGEWYGIYPTEKEAEIQLAKIHNTHEYEVRKINIIQ